MEREEIYLSLPSLLQNILVNVEGWRIYKRRYSDQYEFISREIKENPFLSIGELRIIQEQRMKCFAKSASKISFWKKQFHQHGVDLDGKDILLEIGKLPILSKKKVQDNLDLFNDIKLMYKDILKINTSGTTGSGLKFWRTPIAEKIQWAVWWRYRNWHGIHRDLWCGYFGGRSIIPVSRRRPPYYKINYAGKQLIFSAYHLNPESALSYVNAIIRHSVSWLHGYPSILALLSAYMIEKCIPPIPKIRIITTGAESLLPQQKEIIEKAFKVPVLDHYGQAEGCVNVSMCENGKYHVDEDFAYVEFLPISGIENEYKVIGTNWTNPAFPLFRYDTGDTVTITGHSCSCGINGRVIDSIDGRKEDYITLPDGTKIGRLDHIFKGIVNIREAQITQDDLEKIIIKVVKGEGFSIADERLLLKEARKRIGKKIIIYIKYVNEIEKTKSGKLRFVISSV